MANASGPASAGYLPGEFHHLKSGVDYRVSEESGKVWLSYERDGSSRELKGRQQLVYFLGSGKRGRTYLFEQGGYWFEAPINWYARQKVWDMAPAYQNAGEMPLTLPVDSGCLHCHASGVASSLPDARNHYRDQPFAAGGITCESCHGNAAAHLASGGAVHMLNIARLDALRRDSICLNCHLEGQVAVNRKDKRPEDFRPGDDLFDYAAYFVRKGENGSGGRAVSQWEALLRSRCKQKSGDHLTCTTCHDPHGDPAPDQRISFYRQKCLQCHDQGRFAETHHPDEPDCTACHMGKPPSNDIAHEQVTDHWIRCRASAARQPLAEAGDLVSVGGIPVDDRDLGLAYAQLAAADNSLIPRAITLLHNAEREPAESRGDHELHSQLGFLEQLDGKTDTAAAEYRIALAADQDDPIAAADLGIIEAQAHHYDAAVHLWQEVFTHDPTQVTAGFNLAIVECGAGQPTEALETLDRILQFAPDNERARSMAQAIRAGSHTCRAR
jgi:predicted CXXCH cytochrome family protein